MTPHLADDVAIEEGYARRLPNGDCEAYPDPKSGGAPWTLGHGHTGSDVYPGARCTAVQARAFLTADLEKAIALCDRHIPWWRKLDDVRQDVVVDMMFNMGWDDLRTVRHEGFSGFVNTLAYMRAGFYAKAAEGMQNSQWARDTGTRASRRIAQMRMGVRQPWPGERAAA